MSKNPTDAPQPEQPEQPGQPAASGSRWEPTEAEANAPTQQVAAEAARGPAAPAQAGPAQAGPAQAGPAQDAVAQAADVPPPPAAASYPAGSYPGAPYPADAGTPVDRAPSNATFASIKALSKGAKGALAGAAAVLVLGSGVTGFAIGQLGDHDHQRVDVRFGQTGFARDGDGGRGGFPGQMGQLPQGGYGQFPGQLPPQGGTTDGSGTTQDDGSES